IALAFMSMDCGETVTSRRAYKYEEDGRGPGRWGSVAPNRLGSETVFPFAHAGENLIGSHSLLIWMVGRQTLRWDSEIVSPGDAVRRLARTFAALCHSATYWLSGNVPHVDGGENV